MQARGTFITTDRYGQRWCVIAGQLFDRHHWVVRQHRKSFVREARTK
jgi:hypothetical protein